MYHVVAYPFKSKVVYVGNNYQSHSKGFRPTWLSRHVHRVPPSHQGPKCIFISTHCFSSVEDISNLLFGGANSTSSKIRLDIDLASSEGARKTELRRNSLNTMSRVDVLDKGDLVAGGGALTGDDCG